MYFIYHRLELFLKIKNQLFVFILKIIINSKMGIGDWGPIPNPQSPLEHV